MIKSVSMGVKFDVGELISLQPCNVSPPVGQKVY